MNGESSNSDNALDIQGKGNHLWLVKVPKHLAEKWLSAEGGQNVGKLAINKCSSKITYTASNRIRNIGHQDEIPADYEFKITKITEKDQALAVFSETPVENDKSSLTLEGKVVHKADCKPVFNETYRNLKRRQRELANKPQRETKRINESDVQKYKPINITKEERDEQMRKKSKGNKLRISKDELQNKLYELFEAHQYYSTKNLHAITQQPQNFLSEVLREMCEYGKSPEHPHMWELKEEYRKY